MVKIDPLKDPEFQKVVRHFLNTPPQPHKPLWKKAKLAGGQKTRPASKGLHKGKTIT
jgi:hypothetical protein